MSRTYQQAQRSRLRLCVGCVPADILDRVECTTDNRQCGDLKKVESEANHLITHNGRTSIVQACSQSSQYRSNLCFGSLSGKIGSKYRKGRKCSVRPLVVRLCNIMQVRILPEAPIICIFLKSLSSLVKGAAKNWGTSCVWQGLYADNTN